MHKRLITLFSGCGGFEEGAIRAGWTPVWGVDNWSVAVEAQKLRHRKIVFRDIKEVSFDELDLQADHLHASPPCTNASTAKGYSKEMIDDIDNARSIIDALSVIKPHSFSLENVPAYGNFQSFKNIYMWLNENNYYTSFRVYDAFYLGLPQHRRRLILTARKDKPVAPLKALSSPLKSWYSAIQDLIWELPDCELTNWQMRALDTIAFHDYTLVPKAGARLKNGKLIYIDRHCPAPTIRALGQDRHWQQFTLALPYRHNSISKFKQLSIQCYARLQSFEDDYVFPFPKWQAIRLIGNAVPPLFAKAIMESFDE